MSDRTPLGYLAGCARARDAASAGRPHRSREGVDLAPHRKNFKTPSEGSRRAVARCSIALADGNVRRPNSEVGFQDVEDRFREAWEGGVWMGK
jgi:hypothetical protein